VTERDIFIQAFQEPDPAARVQFLDRACGPDRALRNRVEGLLGRAGEAGSFLERPAIAEIDTAKLDQTWERSAVAATDAITPVGSVIGPYRLLDVLGEGGMGTVYRAEQTEPVKRQVALKLIKPGMDSRSILVRFEAERQALALMDHPNIARVLDAGAVTGVRGQETGFSNGSRLTPDPCLLTPETARPYFVMELVRGLSLTRYCDEKQLTLKERLELFVPVCQAVQHAHQKGVIHRDIKPSNILVAEVDGKPVPKVIDFGVAKATQQRLTEKTLFTAFGTVVGTPEYMSPEQAEPGQMDVDTRSDVYSLGVVLYELLTGTTPLTRQRINDAALLDVLRLIREEEPPKPSKRLGTTAERPCAAATADLESKKLSGLVRGELDWIVMRCLEKDRNRRYQTANLLATDLQRYLADEPVMAGPPGARYRIQKFVRRNKGAVIAASLVLVALVAGIIGTTWGLVKARLHERDAVQAQLAEAERAEGEARAKQAAQARLAQIEKGNEILTAIFADLNPRAEHEARRPLRAILADRLAKAAAQLEGEAVGDPLVVAEMQNRLGRALLNLGVEEPAIAVLEKARKTLESTLGTDHVDTLTTIENLGGAYMAAGRFDLALPLFEVIYKRRMDQFGSDHPDTITSMNNLALCYREGGEPDKAVSLLEEAHRRNTAVRGAESADSLTTMNNLGLCYQSAGRVDLALPLYKEALRLRADKFGPQHHDTLKSMNDLVIGYKASGQLDLALPLAKETLQLRTAKFGADHPDTLLSMANLADTYLLRNQLDLALPLLEETLKLRKARHGDEHPRTLDSMNDLAAGYKAARKFNLALPLFEETLKLRKAHQGENHPETLLAMNNLASCHIDAGKPQLALPLLQEALKDQRERLSADHPRTLATLNNLAVAQKATGRLDLALPLYEETLALRKARLGADHPETLLSTNNLGSCYYADSKLDLALPLLEEAAAGVEKRQFMHEHASRIVNNLIVCYERLRQYPQAEEWRCKWLAEVGRKSGEDSLAFATELNGLGRNLILQKNWSGAQEVLGKAVTLREKHDPDSWRTFSSKSRLGVALMGQNKHSEAEPYMREGYLGMKQRAATIPEQMRTDVLTEALRQLVRLYQETGKSDEVSKWQRELEAQRKAPRSKGN
jgi:eukaryotic-like serine/threonine-protein kinase